MASLIFLLFLSCTAKGQQDEEAFRKAERARNLGLNFGLGGALAGMMFFAGSFVYLTRKANRLNKELTLEKEKSEALLLNILPEDVAEELKKNGRSAARMIHDATVLFTDFENFTAIAAKMSAEELVEELDASFRAFENICEKYHIEKIKVIGDSFMAAGGLNGNADAVNTAIAALEMMEAAEGRWIEHTNKNLPAFRMRIGLHSGPVAAGIVGGKKFQFDIWGDTVNTASRMESAGESGKINCSAEFYHQTKHCNDLAYIKRDEQEIKGKGIAAMYFLERKA
jgi:adenylate cyclase